MSYNNTYLLNLFLPYISGAGGGFHYITNSNPITKIPYISYLLYRNHPKT